MSGIDTSLFYYWLALSGLSTKKQNTLLERMPAGALWEQFSREPKIRDFVGENAYAALSKTHNMDLLQKRAERLQARGIGILTRIDGNFPEALLQKEVNPPLALYYQGDTALLRSKCIAIVGTRRCSRYGKDCTFRFAEDLVSGGFTIVSGLATGIDTYAHSAAIHAGGNTIAVLGGGHGHIYPAINAPLAARIVESGGLVLSEYPPEFVPTRFSFPERNRLISGLSMGTLVIEAGEKSGTLITVECALEQGKEVYAVPGSIYSSKSAGTNLLIQSGQAMLVLSAADIYADMKMKLPEFDSKSCRVVLDLFEEKIYNLLENEQKHFDELMLESGMDHGELSALLIALELKGAIRRQPSNIYARVHAAGRNE